MTESENFFTETKSQVQDYVNEKILLIKLQVLEKVSKIVGAIFSALIMLLLSFFIVLFLSIMGGYYFAHLTGSLFYGFGIIAGFYVLLFIIFLIIKKKYLDVGITNFIIDILFEKSDKEHENK